MSPVQLEGGLGPRGQASSTPTFAGILPATSMVEISRLIDPAMLVEVEVVAHKAGVGDQPSVGGPA